MRKHERPKRHRFNMYGILIICCLSLVAGRIANVVNREGDSAMLSANDRSRWVTMAAVVENGTFAIDELITRKTEKGHRIWDTIDKVRHVGSDGKLHYYSSKPTLLTSLLSGVYGAVHYTTGLRLTDHPIYVPRLLLLLINLPVLALFLVSITLVIEDLDVSDFTKRFTFASGCFATMVTPFSISLNNHLFAAAATSLTLYLYLRASRLLTDEFSAQTYLPRFWPWMIAGTSAAFAVACELPALSMFCLWALLFAILAPRSIPGFAFGALLVFAGIFGTNYWAHGSWKTPYAHRGVGEIIEQVPGQWSSNQFNANAGKDTLLQTLMTTQSLAGASDLQLRELAAGGYEVLAEFGSAPVVRQQQFKLQASSIAKAKDFWELAVWDDWYDYPRSYWRGDNRRGVDLGEPSRVKYLFHATLGMYGLFSLTPIWALVPLGMAYGCFFGRRYSRRLMAAIVLASAVCMAFYVARPEIDRNYGGVSVCFRWMLWFAPLWLYCLVNEVSRLSESAPGRGFAMLLFAASVFSVSTSLDSPWQHPWIYRFASFLGWLGG